MLGSEKQRAGPALSPRADHTSWRSPCRPRLSTLASTLSIPRVPVRRPRRSRSARRTRAPSSASSNGSATTPRTVTRSCASASSSPTSTGRPRLAERYRNNRAVSLEDLRQVARLGLVKAVDRYQPERANPFIPYAVATVVGELKRHLRDASWLRIAAGDQGPGPAPVPGHRRAAPAARPLTVPELADHLGASPEEVLEAIEVVQTRSAPSSTSRPRRTARPCSATSWSTGATARSWRTCWSCPS